MNIDNKSCIMNDEFRYIKIEIKIANVHANKRRLSAHPLKSKCDLRA